MVRFIRWLARFRADFRPKSKASAWASFIGPERMQFVVRNTCAMIDAAVQRDVAAMPKRSHDVSLPGANDCVHLPSRLKG